MRVNGDNNSPIDVFVHFVTQIFNGGSASATSGATSGASSAVDSAGPQGGPGAALAASSGSAQALGLRGYTRNQGDGSVEVLAQGTRPALERLLTLLRKGPTAAEVSEVRTEWGQPTEHLSGFHVRW